MRALAREAAVGANRPEAGLGFAAGGDEVVDEEGGAFETDVGVLARGRLFAPEGVFARVGVLARVGVEVLGRGAVEGFLAELEATEVPV